MPSATRQMSMERISTRRPVARNAHEVADMRAAVDEAADHTVTRDDEILHGRGQIRQCREESGPKPPVGLPSVVDERVVIAVVAGHEGVHQVGVVVVEHLDVGLGEALFGVVFMASNANPGAASSIALLEFLAML